MRNDSELWEVASATLSLDQQIELQSLLERQSEGGLSPIEQNHLQTLLDEYGRLMVRKAHAWLLLARRGYRVPPQSNEK
jgi:hypothetical protein